MAFNTRGLCRGTTKTWLRAGTALGVGLCAFGPLPSQAGTPEPSAQPKPAATLEQVVVTATRRTERLQKVPVSVSVLSQSFLRDHDVRSLQDLAATTPGLVTTNDSGYGTAPLAIRGIGGANGGGNFFADEPVAVYEDGAYVSRVRFATTDLLDTDSIQVLRGPQGTLFGRNATAGAILITTAQPTDHLTGFINTTIASFGEYRVNGAVSGPLDPAGKLEMRAALAYSDIAGWGTNSYNDTKLNGSHEVTGRLTLKFRPADDLTFTAAYERLDSNASNGNYSLYNSSNLASATNPGGSDVVFPYQRAANYNSLISSNTYDQNAPSTTRTTGNNITLHAQYDLDAFSIYSISNYRNWHTVGQQDSDGLGGIPPLPPFVTGANDGYGTNSGTLIDSQWSEELRAASTDSTSRYKWTAGAMFYGENNAISPFIINDYLVGPGGAGTSAIFDAHQQTLSWSGFAEGSYKITDKLSFTLGGRYSVDKKDFSDLFTLKTINQFAPPGPPVPLFPAGTVLALLPSGGTSYFYNFSPRAVVDYQFTDTLFGYASVSRGYKSGGYNAFDTGPTPPFAPEKNTAYEAGVKSDLLGGRARLNVSAYDYEYSNLQIRQGVPSGGVSIANVASARSAGGEIEGQLVPIPGLTLTGNIAYDDAYILKGVLGQVNGPSFVFGSATTSVVSVAGNQLSRAPHWETYLAADYKWAIGEFGTADALFDFRSQSAEYFLETEQQVGNTFYGNGWYQVDLHVSFVPRNTRFTIAGFIENLNDERHVTQVASAFALPLASVNAPRQFGLQLGYRF